jgi:hypothetical protein
MVLINVVEYVDTTETFLLIATAFIFRRCPMYRIKTRIIYFCSRALARLKHKLVDI